MGGAYYPRSYEYDIPHMIMIEILKIMKGSKK